MLSYGFFSKGNNYFILALQKIGSIPLYLFAIYNLNSKITLYNKWAIFEYLNFLKRTKFGWFLLLIFFCRFCLMFWITNGFMISESHKLKWSFYCSMCYQSRALNVTLLLAFKGDKIIHVIIIYSKELKLKRFFPPSRIIKNSLMDLYFQSKDIS